MGLNLNFFYSKFKAFIKETCVHPVFIYLFVYLDLVCIGQVNLELMILLPQALQC